MRPLLLLILALLLAGCASLNTFAPPRPRLLLTGTMPEDIRLKVTLHFDATYRLPLCRTLTAQTMSFIQKSRSETYQVESVHPEDAPLPPPLPDRVDAPLAPVAVWPFEQSFDLSGGGACGYKIRAVYIKAYHWRYVQLPAGTTYLLLRPDESEKQRTSYRALPQAPVQIDCSRHSYIDVNEQLKHMLACSKEYTGYFVDGELPDVIHFDLDLSLRQ